MRRSSDQRARAVSALVVSALFAAGLQAQTVSLHPFARGGKYGYMDAEGAAPIPATYAGARDFSEGLAPAALIVGEEVYDKGSYGKKCFVKVVRWGFIGTGGQWVIRPKFSSADGFHEGLAFVGLAGTGGAGYIDKSGKVVILIDSEHASAFDRGIAVTGDRYESSHSLIDRNGRVLARQQGRMEMLGEGMVAFAAEYKGPFGLMDATGKVIQPPVFEAVSPYSESVAAVSKDGKLQFIDSKGTVAIPFSFEDPDRYVSAEMRENVFREGLSVVYQRGRFGFIDHSGRFVIAPKFISAGSFNGGLAKACVDAGSDSRCGFIDKTGSFVVSPRFGSAESFVNGLATVEDPVFGSEMRVNRTGRIVDRPKRSDTPDLSPYGECEFPRPVPAPAPETYSVGISLASSPTGASVYLIPLWDWQTSGDGARVLENPDALAAYLVTEGPTPLKDLRLKAQVYMAVFEKAGRRTIARVVVAENGSHQVAVSF